MDYNLTFHKTGQVQGVMAIRVRQAKFVTAAGGLEASRTSHPGGPRHI